jgi:hypothetical protein
MNTSQLAQTVKRSSLRRMEVVHSAVVTLQRFFRMLKWRRVGSNPDMHMMVARTLHSFLDDVRKDGAVARRRASARASLTEEVSSVAEAALGSTGESAPSEDEDLEEEDDEEGEDEDNMRRYFPSSRRGSLLPGHTAEFLEACLEPMPAVLEEGEVPEEEEEEQAEELESAPVFPASELPHGNHDSTGLQASTSPDLSRSDLVEIVTPCLARRSLLKAPSASPSKAHRVTFAMDSSTDGGGSGDLLPPRLEASVGGVPRLAATQSRPTTPSMEAARDFAVLERCPAEGVFFKRYIRRNTGRQLPVVPS